MICLGSRLGVSISRKRSLISPLDFFRFCRTPEQWLLGCAPADYRILGAPDNLHVLYMWSGIEWLLGDGIRGTRSNRLTSMRPTSFGRGNGAVTRWRASK